MMSVPARILERRAELERLVEHHRRAFEDHRHWLAVKVAERDGIDLCIAAIEGAAKVHSGEAVEGAEASAATPQAREAENALAGSVEGLRPGAVDPGWPVVLPANKKPRAPKRDIRGMVMHWVAEWPERVQTTDGLAEAIGVSRRVVEKAVAHWQAKGRLTLDGGVVRLRAASLGDAVEPDPLLASYADDHVEPQQSAAAE